MTRWFLNPWVQLGLEALLVTAAEIFIKVGATRTATAVGAPTEWLGISGLQSGWVWLGIICTILSFVSWLYVLKHIPLSIAFPVSNVVHALVPVGCWLFLAEAISLRRWCGIAVVFVGLVVVAKPVSRLEEKL